MVIHNLVTHICHSQHGRQGIFFIGNLLRSPITAIAWANFETSLGTGYRLRLVAENVVGLEPDWYLICQISVERFDIAVHLNQCATESVWKRWLALINAGAAFTRINRRDRLGWNHI